MSHRFEARRLREDQLVVPQPDRDVKSAPKDFKPAEWTDNDIMPCGPFAGTKLCEVPATHWDLLRDSRWLKVHPELAEYLKRNERDIDRELIRCGAADDDE